MIVSDAARISRITWASATKCSYLLKGTQGATHKGFIEGTLQEEVTNFDRFWLEIKGIILSIIIFLFLALIGSSLFTVGDGIEQDGLIARIPSSIGSHSRGHGIPTDNKFGTDQGRTRDGDKRLGSVSVTARFVHIFYLKKKCIHIPTYLMPRINLWLYRTGIAIKLLVTVHLFHSLL